ncbi:hypothetical protein B0H11DRAFT_2105237 [Mycena galericulata]|nr:hypothetical protein B0H11DRAFT_2105237 [Mycena galericulata]
MHRALEIPELAEVICSHLSSEYLYQPDFVRPTSSTCDLAALARTCKIFQNPALDVLWSYQTTFAHVLRCMPSDLWNGPVVYGSVYLLDAIRPIAPADWDRPLFYLHRVKFLSCLGRNLPSPALFETLRLCRPTDHFFPNLRCLVWNYLDRVPNFPSIRTLLSPRLTSLEVVIPTSFTGLSLIPTLANRCPLLTHVSIRSDHPIPADFHPHLRTSISLFVCAGTRIKELHVSDLDQSAFEHLACLSSLRSLTLDNLQALNPFPTFGLPGTTLFSGLQEIYISTYTGPAITVLKALASSRIAYVSVTILEVMTPIAISTLYATLAENLPQDSLEYLRISNSLGAAVVSPNQATIQRRVLRRLLCFPNLKNVALAFCGGFDLDDTLVSEISRAWPHLTHLSFNHSRTTPIVSRVTLSGLRNLVHHCTKLTILHMEIDASIIPSDDTPPYSVKPRLLLLQVGYAPITNASAVADFLLKNFPKLMGVHASEVGVGGEQNDDADIFFNRWLDVDEVVTRRNDMQ